MERAVLFINIFFFFFKKSDKGHLVSLCLNVCVFVDSRMLLFDARMHLD